MIANSLFENTHFINLEHQLERLAHIKKELAKINVVGNRFNAIKLANGVVGRSMSHLKCLELAKQNGSPYVFICEDNIQFLDPELFLKNLELFCESVNTEWDVLIISGNFSPPFESIGDFCVKITNCQTTAGYVVQQHYYDTLIANYKESISKNKDEYAWKQLQENDRWYMIVPQTVVKIEFSDVEERETNYKQLIGKKERLFRAPSIYGFKTPHKTLQQNSIQQGFNLGIKHRNQFNIVNGKMNLTKTRK